MSMDIFDVEDAALGATLFDEWKEEYEEKFFDPINEIQLVGIAENITPEELEQLKEIDPETWDKIMEIREEKIINQESA